MTCRQRSCCGFISLRTGSLIIGYFNLVASFILFVVFLIALIAIIPYLQRQTYTYWQDVVQVFFVAASMVLMLVNMLFTMSLLYGVHKYQARYIRPYLVFNVIFLVFHIIEFAISFVYIPSVGEIIINVITIILTAYWLLVIRSYWLELKESGPPMSPGIVFAPPVQPVTVYPQPAEYPAPGYPVPAGYPGAASYPGPPGPGYPAPEGYPAPGSLPAAYARDAKLPIDPPAYQSP